MKLGLIFSIGANCLWLGGFVFAPVAVQAGSIESRFSRLPNGLPAECGAHKNFRPTLCRGAAANRGLASVPGDLFGPTKRQSTKFSGTGATANAAGSTSAGVRGGVLTRGARDGIAASGAAGQGAASSGRVDANVKRPSVWQRLTPERVAKLEYWQHVRYIKLMRERMLVLDELQRQERQLAGVYGRSSGDARSSSGANATRNSKKATYKDARKKDGRKKSKLADRLDRESKLTDESNRASKLKSKTSRLPASFSPTTTIRRDVADVVNDSEVVGPPFNRRSRQLSILNCAGFVEDAYEASGHPSGVGVYNTHGGNAVSDACFRCQQNSDSSGYLCSFANTGLWGNEACISPHASSTDCRAVAWHLTEWKADKIKNTIGKCNDSADQKAYICEGGKDFFKQLRKEQPNLTLIQKTAGSDQIIKSTVDSVKFMFENAIDPRVMAYLHKYLKALEKHVCSENVTNSLPQPPCQKIAQDLIRDTVFQEAANEACEDRQTEDNCVTKMKQQLFDRTFVSKKGKCEECSEGGTPVNNIGIGEECLTSKDNRQRLLTSKANGKNTIQYCAFSLAPQDSMVDSLVKQMHGSDAEYNADGDYEDRSHAYCHELLADNVLCQLTDYKRFKALEEQYEKYNNITQTTAGAAIDRKMKTYDNVDKLFKSLYTETDSNAQSVLDSFRQQKNCEQNATGKRDEDYSNCHATDEGGQTKHYCFNKAEELNYIRNTLLAVQNKYSNSSSTTDKTIRAGEILAVAGCSKIKAIKDKAKDIEASGPLGCVPPEQGNGACSSDESSKGRCAELEVTGAAECVACAAERAMINASGNQKDYEVSSKWLSLMSTMANVCEDWGYNGAPILQNKYIEVFGHCTEDEYNFGGIDKANRYKVSNAVVRCKNKNSPEEKQQCLKESFGSSEKNDDSSGPKLGEHFEEIYGLKFSAARELFACPADPNKGECIENCPADCVGCANCASDEAPEACIAKSRRDKFNEKAAEFTKPNSIVARSPPATSSLAACLKKAQKVQKTAYTKNNDNNSCVKWVNASDCGGSGSACQASTADVTLRIDKTLNLLGLARRVARKPAQDDSCPTEELELAFKGAQEPTGAMILTHATMCRVAHSKEPAGQPLEDDPAHVNFDYRGEFDSKGREDQHLILKHNGTIQDGEGAACSRDFSISLIGDHCAIGEAAAAAETGASGGNAAAR